MPNTTQPSSSSSFSPLCPSCGFTLVLVDDAATTQATCPATSFSKQQQQQHQRPRLVAALFGQKSSWRNSKNKNKDHYYLSPPPPPPESSDANIQRLPKEEQEDDPAANNTDSVEMACPNPNCATSSVLYKKKAPLASSSSSMDVGKKYNNNNNNNNKALPTATQPEAIKAITASSSSPNFNNSKKNKEFLASSTVTENASKPLLENTNDNINKNNNAQERERVPTAVMLQPKESSSAPANTTTMVASKGSLGNDTGDGAKAEPETIKEAAAALEEKDASSSSSSSSPPDTTPPSLQQQQPHDQQQHQDQSTRNRATEHPQVLETQPHDCLLTVNNLKEQVEHLRTEQQNRHAMSADADDELAQQQQQQQQQQFQGSILALRQELQQVQTRLTASEEQIQKLKEDEEEEDDDDDEYIETERVMQKLAQDLQTCLIRIDNLDAYYQQQTSEHWLSTTASFTELRTQLDAVTIDIVQQTKTLIKTSQEEDMKKDKIWQELQAKVSSSRLEKLESKAQKFQQQNAEQVAALETSVTDLHSQLEQFQHNVQDQHQTAMASSKSERDNLQSSLTTCLDRMTQFETHQAVTQAQAAAAFDEKLAELRQGLETLQLNLVEQGMENATLTDVKAIEERLQTCLARIDELCAKSDQDHEKVSSETLALSKKMESVLVEMQELEKRAKQQIQEASTANQKDLEAKFQDCLFRLEAVGQESTKEHEQSSKQFKSFVESLATIRGDIEQLEQNSLQQTQQAIAAHEQDTKVELEKCTDRMEHFAERFEADRAQHSSWLDLALAELRLEMEGLDDRLLEQSKGSATLADMVFTEGRLKDCLARVDQLEAKCQSSEENISQQTTTHNTSLSQLRKDMEELEQRLSRQLDKQLQLQKNQVQAQLEAFSWRMDEIDAVSENNYKYVSAETSNLTESLAQLQQNTVEMKQSIQRQFEENATSQRMFTEEQVETCFSRINEIWEVSESEIEQLSSETLCAKESLEVLRRDMENQEKDLLRQLKENVSSNKAILDEELQKCLFQIEELGEKSETERSRLKSGTEVLNESLGETRRKLNELEEFTRRLSECSPSHGDVQKLDEQLQNCTQRLNDLRGKTEDEQKDALEQISRLTQSITDTRHDMDALEKNVIKQTLELTQKNRTDLEQQLELCNTRIDQLRETFNQEKKQTSAATEALNSTLSEFRGNVERLEQRIAEQTKSLASATEVRSLQEYVKQCNVRIGELCKKRENDVLKTTMDSTVVKETIAETDRQVQVLGKQVTQQSKDTAHLAANTLVLVDQLKNQIKTHQEVVAVQRRSDVQELAKTRNELHSVTTTLETARTSLGGLPTRVDGNDRAIAVLQESYASFAENMVSMFASQKEVNQKLQNELDAVRIELAELRHERRATQMASQNNAMILGKIAAVAALPGLKSAHSFRIESSQSIASKSDVSSSSHNQGLLSQQHDNRSVLSRGNASHRNKSVAGTVSIDEYAERLYGLIDTASIDDFAERLLADNEDFPRDASSSRDADVASTMSDFVPENMSTLSSQMMEATKRKHESGLVGASSGASSPHRIEIKGRVEARAMNTITAPCTPDSGDVSLIDYAPEPSFQPTQLDLAL